MRTEHLKKAVFVDRDGVLNDLVDRGEGFLLGGKPFRWTAPFNRQELRIKPYAREALEIIALKGYLRVLVTNQPDVRTGRIKADEFVRMMAIVHELPLSAVYVCTHVPKDGCLCRKPAPGMLVSARDALGIDMDLSYMIGDMETDVQAGKAAGVRTILVTDSPAITSADHRVLNIMEAARLLP